MNKKTNVSTKFLFFWIIFKNKLSNLNLFHQYCFTSAFTKSGDGTHQNTNNISYNYCSIYPWISFLIRHLVTNLTIIKLGVNSFKKIIKFIILIFKIIIFIDFTELNSYCIYKIAFNFSSNLKINRQVFT